MRNLGFGRIMCVLLCGGVLLQTGGCGATLIPSITNLVTSLIINSLVGAVAGGLAT